jgi:hypothetical protein
MAALSYKPYFVTPIKRKIKRQTIRNFRKIPIRVGERLFFFTGMRTKHCKKFGEAICTHTCQIIITECSVKTITATGWTIITDKFFLNHFAIKDGFKDWNDLIQWWKKNHGENCFRPEYKGTLIEFDLLPKNQWLKKKTIKKQLA